jgi:hypothetical protein
MRMIENEKRKKHILKAKTRGRLVLVFDNVIFKLNSHNGGVQSKLAPLGTSATSGLLYLPRVTVRMEKLVEWTVVAGWTEVLAENLPRRYFVHIKSHLPDLGANPGRSGGKPATNRFSYGVAFDNVISEVVRMLF